MWHFKTKTAPVIVGALDMAKKGTDKRINNIPWQSQLIWNTKNYILRNSIINVTKKYHQKKAAKNMNT